MALTSNDEIVELIKTLVGATYDKVSDEGFEQAAQRAQDELKWSVPESDATKCYWIIERARRHLLYILLVESAHKFRFKEIHLHNRFAQYYKLLEFMDKEFLRAIEENATLFDTGTYGHFGSYLTNGFVYDFYGNDHTYDGWK